MNLMFKISYGLYVLSARSENADNGCIINTLMQQTSAPERVSVTVNKANLTAELIDKSGAFSVAILSSTTEFPMIRDFGMRSGRSADKFEGIESERGQNGILSPIKNVIGILEVKVLEKKDLGSHYLFLGEVTAAKEIKDGEPLTYGYYQSNIKPKAKTEKPVYICRVCGYKTETPPGDDFVCPICKHGKTDMELVGNAKTIELTADNDGKKNIDSGKGETKMAKYVCMVCGYSHEGDAAPEICPVCKAPASKFIKQEGEKSWAAEHVIGVAKGVDEDIIKDLRANFNGECCEVGMYLAMSRAAFREGYAEIGMYYEKAAFEEAEHAAKFAELLGEVVTDSTKKNLEMRVEAENGATLGKFELAKKAKIQNLDAIHDTVHEMARDEARHGKAFLGLLNRYFK